MQFVVGLLHARCIASPSSRPALAVSLWRWLCCTQSTKWYLHSTFLDVLELVCLFSLGSYATLEQDYDIMYSRCDALAAISPMWSHHVRSCESVTPSRQVQFICSKCLSITVISRISGGYVVDKYAHFLRFVVTWLLAMTVIQVQMQTWTIPV